MKASVANCEIPTDHAITATIYDLAFKKGIKYIIGGGNLVTKGIIPESWGYHSKDLKYLKSIHRKFSRIKLKDFPQLGLSKWIYGTFVKKIKIIPILNYFPYVKKDAKEVIKRELGWRDYGAKHHESIYTRFFQGYILPEKFGFDKRKAHFSTLINSGQMTRDEALKEMEENNPYPNREMMENDKEYVIKRLEITNEEFDKIMNQAIKTYKDYPNNAFLFKKSSPFIKFAKRIITNN